MVGLKPRDSWETPWNVVDAVAAFMGRPPWMDLCASAENSKAVQWIGETAAEGGPLQRWDPEEMGRRCGPDDWFWLNPPYSRAAILSILTWAAVAAEHGATIAVLVNIDKSTRWYRAILPRIRCELVPQTRIQFIPPPGVKATRNNKMQSILIIGPRRPWDPPAGEYKCLPLEI